MFPIHINSPKLRISLKICSILSGPILRLNSDYVITTNIVLVQFKDFNDEVRSVPLHTRDISTLQSHLSIVRVARHLSVQVRDTWRWQCWSLSMATHLSLLGLSRLEITSAWTLQTLIKKVNMIIKLIFLFNCINHSSG